MIKICQFYAKRLNIWPFYGYWLIPLRPSFSLGHQCHNRNWNERDITSLILRKHGESKKKKGRVLKITWRKKDLDIGSRKYQLIFSWLVDVHKHKTFATRRVRWPTSIYHGRGGGGWRIFGCVTIIITWSHHNALCYFFWPTPPPPLIGSYGHSIPIFLWFPLHTHPPPPFSLKP